MVKLKAKLPKDDANGVDDFEVELAGNLRNGKLVPVIALLATEDVLARNNVPIVVIDDIEGVPEDRREHVLEILGAIKAERTGRKTGAQTLDIGDEERVEPTPVADAEAPPAEPTPITRGRRK